MPDTEEQRKNQLRAAQQFQTLFRERLPVLQGYEDFANSQLDEMIGQLVPGARDLFRQSVNYFGQYEEQVAPAIGKFIQEAEGYDTPERRADERGRAMEDVRSASEASRQQAISRLESFGIDPSQTRGAALDANLRLATALGQVQAGKEAERSVEERGVQRRGQGIQLGKSLFGAGQATFQQGSRALGEGLDATQNVAVNFANILGTPQTLLTGKLGAINNSVDAKIAEEAAKAAKGAGGSAAAFAGIGQAAGTLGGAALGGYFGAGNPAAISAGAQAGGTAGGLPATFLQ